MDKERPSIEGMERRFYGLTVAFLLAALFMGASLVLRQFSKPVVGDTPQGSAGNVELPRGTIVDRNGSVLAIDIFIYDVEASPAQLKPTPKAHLASTLGNILGVDPNEIRPTLETPAPYVTIATGQSAGVAEAVRALRNDPYNPQPVKVVPHPKRYYPEGNLAAHVLGFVNQNPGGCYGVEGYYNEQLKGRVLPIEDLEAALLNPQGASTTLVLTIDRYAQRVVETELENAIRRTGAVAGQIIVLAPDTGELLAMASWPTYSPANYLESGDSHWNNAAISQVYEPGSVFKIITYASALDSQAITLQETFYDSGLIEIGGRKIYNWDRAGHGYVDAVEALGDSLNVVAAQITQRMGRDAFYLYVRRFGFGRLTEIDLQGEASGLVKTPYKDDPTSAQWSDADLGTNSFGQGISVTPIQMVNAVASIANRGLMMAPHVVKAKIVDGKTEEMPQVAVRRTVSSQAAETLTTLLVQVVDQYLEEAQVEGYSIAGKTGTAEIPIGGAYHPTEYIASFVGYGPASDPKLAILVKLDRPKTDRSGRAAAAPTFARIAEALFRYFEIPPDRAN